MQNRWNGESSALSIFSFIQILYLKQQNKFETKEFANALFGDSFISHIFCSLGIAYTGLKSPNKMFYSKLARLL